MFSLQDLQGASKMERKGMKRLGMKRDTEEVSQTSDTERRFINKCKRRKRQYFGHKEEQQRQVNTGNDNPTSNNARNKAKMW